MYKTDKVAIIAAILTFVMVGSYIWITTDIDIGKNMCVNMGGTYSLESYSGELSDSKRGVCSFPEFGTSCDTNMLNKGITC